jgi:hypothetical protein
LNPSRTLREALVTLFVHAFFSAGLLAQFSDTVYFSRQKMRADIEEMVERITLSHPDPFGFVTPENFGRQVEKTLVSLPDSATYGQFAVHVADVLNALRDSHTCLDYTALLNHQLEHDGYFMPVQVITDNGHVHIRKDRDSILPAGARLLSLNGHSADSLWQLARRYACIEGDAELGRNRVADAIFPIVCGMHFTITPKLTVDVTPVDSVDIYRHTYRCYNEARWRERRKIIRKEEEHPVRLSYPEEGIAHLVVETFAPENSAKYGNAIRKAFRSIRDSPPQALIIDIRDNGGGSSSWVEYLYSFIDEQGYNTPNNIIGRNSELARSRVRAMNKSFSRFILKTFYRKNEDVQGILRITGGKEGRNDTLFFREPSLQRKSLVYTGACVLLMNGMTASAGVDFSNQFIRSGRGKSFGEPCFGPTSGTWGNPARHVLRHSKIPVYISTIRYNYDQTFQFVREAIHPAYPVNPDMHALSTGKDAVLARALEYIRTNHP